MTCSKLAILVGGGPAPGINGVIGAATIEAVNNGLSVLGLYDGFKWLSSEHFVPERHAVELKIRDVARIHFEGGSILRTARTALIDEAQAGVSTVVRPDERKVANVLRNLTEIGVTHVLTIGGDDTALSSRFVAERTGGRVRVVHVPKTIDNDLPLPGDAVTFGFTTARHLGSDLVANLMEDARTTGRWYVVVLMGRHAGFLALGTGKSTGATLTLIPEEFPETTTIQEIADVLEGAIIKRKAMGRNDGVAVVAEGLAYRLGDREEIEGILGKTVTLDAAGHIRLAEIPLARILCDQLVKRFAKRSETVAIVPQTLGYVLRCAPPTPKDMSDCRDLGHGAVRLLLDESYDLTGGVMVALQGWKICRLRFADMIDPKTNRTRIRTVDIDSDLYRVARAYMIRLETSDLDDPAMLAKLATAAGCSEAEFIKKFRKAATRITNHAIEGALNAEIPPPDWSEAGQPSLPPR